jgi:hypothetical protein
MAQQQNPHAHLHREIPIAPTLTPPQELAARWQAEMDRFAH